MKRRWWLRATIILLALSTARAATAQICPATPPACNDPLAVVNPVYILAADTQVPVLHKLGKLLRAQTTPITVVYIPNGSCTNISNLYSTPPKFTAGTGGGPYYVPADPTFDPSVKTACACTPPAGGLTPDMAISIVFPDAADCPTAPAKPSTILISQGPVQAMTFVVPYDTATNAGSSERAITAEEAYLVLGLGAASAMVTPWSDPNFIFGRPASKGTQISIGANIKVPAAKWKLVADVMHQIDQSSALAAAIAALATDPNADKALGILGTEIYDKATNRAKMHSLAFRAFNQLHAYWPDTTATAFDKRNVRDGHYTLWSYVQYLAPQDLTGTKAKNPNAQTLIDMMVGNPVTTLPAFEPLDSVISSGLVPLCAMNVARSSEGGDLSLFSAAAQCSCYYDAKVPSGSTSCAACGSTPCATGTCRRGYCEAK